MTLDKPLVSLWLGDDTKANTQEIRQKPYSFETAAALESHETFAGFTT